LTNVIIYENVYTNDNVIIKDKRGDWVKNDVIKAIMHPIRLRIIQELNLKKSATTKEIQRACGDCSQATLYRHLKTLLEYEIIEVVHENNINGIIEKVYALTSNSTEIIIGNPKNFQKMII
jgi:DNA-binding HxlR family transcriptional regulator